MGILDWQALDYSLSVVRTLTILPTVLGDEHRELVGILGTRCKSSTIARCGLRVLGGKEHISWVDADHNLCAALG